MSEHIFCEKCGHKNITGNKFCEACGSALFYAEEEARREGEVVIDTNALSREQQLNAALYPDEMDTVVATGAFSGVRKDEKKNERGKKRWMIPLILAILLASGVGGYFVYAHFQDSSVSVDLTKNLDLDDLALTGEDGEGTLKRTDLDSRNIAKYPKGNKDVSTFIDGVTYTIDKTDKLSNGDTIVVTAEYDEEEAEKYDITVKGVSKSLKVSGLEEVEEEEKEETGVIKIKSVTASSTLPDEDGFTYVAGNIVDGDVTTAWTEGVNGGGVNERVTIQLEKPAKVRGMIIYNGYQKEDVYEKNNRVRDMEVEFSDGTRETCMLYDVMQGQVILFSETKETSSVSLIIKSIVEGSSWDDTCISEVKLMDPDATIPADMLMDRSVPCTGNETYEDLLYYDHSEEEPGPTGRIAPDDYEEDEDDVGQYDGDNEFVGTWTLMSVTSEDTTRPLPESEMTFIFDVYDDGTVAATTNGQSDGSGTWYLLDGVLFVYDRYGEVMRCTLDEDGLMTIDYTNQDLSFLMQKE